MVILNATLKSRPNNHSHKDEGEEKKVEEEEKKKEKKKEKTIESKISLLSINLSTSSI